MTNTMKTLCLILIISTLCGCSKDSATSEVTADDVAWATDWKIFKKPLKSIISDPVYSIGIVVLNEEGVIISEGPWSGSGTDSAISGDTMVCVAIKKNADSIECKLRLGGSSISTELGEGFGKSFSWNSDQEIVDDIILFATDANSVPAGGRSLMKAKGKKIGLKVYKNPRPL